MSERDVNLLLEDILQAINTIEDYTTTIRYFDDFVENRMLAQAVYFNFTIIGEAVAQLPLSFREEYPYIDWRVIKDMRNFIVHEYFGISPKVVWDTIQFELSGFKEQITALIKKINHHE